jgi:hypothetical protein
MSIALSISFIIFTSATIKHVFFGLTVKTIDHIPTLHDSQAMIS